MSELMHEYECQTIHDAEKMVYELLLKQVPQKEIMKIEFIIKDIPRHFNPVQISKIKRKFENIEKPDDKKRPLEANLFKLFKQGISPIDAVIKTGLDPNFVESTYKRYLEFLGISTIATAHLNELTNIALHVEQSLNPDATEDDIGWDELVGHYRDLAYNL